MTTPYLLSMYAAAGVVFGYVVYRRTPERNLRTAGSIVAAVILWPLWAPFAITAAPSARRGPLATRIAAALVGDGAPGAPMDFVMQPSAALSLLAEVERAETRLGEIEAHLRAAQSALGDAASLPIDDSGARAQIRAATIEQLDHLRRRQHQALVDLAEVCELLRAQAALAEFGLSDRAEDLRDELWARVQALSELSSLART